MPRARTRPRDLFGRLIPQRRGRLAEARRQASIVDFVRRCYPDILIAHVPNGMSRTKAEAGKLKWMGVLRGWPDLIVALPQARTLWWEVKDDDGTLSDDQIVVAEALSSMGHWVSVVRSIDDARRELAAFQVHSREAR